MKPILTIILIQIATIMAIAQPTLNVSNHLPNFGDYYQNSVIMEPQNIEPGPSGANQTWDFSKLPAPIGSPVTATFIDPEGTPYQAQATGCNLAITTGPEFYQYLKTSDSGYDWYTLMINGNFALYTDPFTILKFPFTYLSEFTDNYDYTIVPGEGMTSHFYGSTTVTADGYGTLTTPLGTFNNVLRVARKYENHCITTIGTVQLPSLDSTIEYQWYAENITYPLLSMTTMPDSIGVLDLIYLTSYQTGVNEISTSPKITVYPNPVNERMEITCTAPFKSLTLYDISGKQVLNKALSNSIRKESLTVGDLKPGIYFVDIGFVSGTNAKRKVIIQ